MKLYRHYSSEYVTMLCFILLICTSTPPMNFLKCLCARARCASTRARNSFQRRTVGNSSKKFNGVPLVAFPLLVPQKYMASKIAALGYGKEADLFTMNATELVAIAKEVFIDTRYRQRVRKVSKIIKSRKHPGEVAADAVEHVMEYGADHLQPHGSLSLNIIEFYMLDVLLFWLILLQW